MSTVSAVRYHDFSMGHRVVGHEGKCRFLHGHNYRVHFEVQADNNELDGVGRVMDFGVIKTKLCQWLEDNWDHQFLVWDKDHDIRALRSETRSLNTYALLTDSLVMVPFNPTAENMAIYLVEHIGPMQLANTGCTLTRVTVEETRKCACTSWKDTP